MTENWYAFRAYNSMTHYGYGTTDEAERYTDHLNARRDINHYAPSAVPEGLVVELKLADSDLGFSLAIALEDIDSEERGTER